jgi:hypothetical protein
MPLPSPLGGVRSTVGMAVRAPSGLPPPTDVREVVAGADAGPSLERSIVGRVLARASLSPPAIGAILHLRHPDRHHPPHPTPSPPGSESDDRSGQWQLPWSAGLGLPPRAARGRGRARSRDDRAQRTPGKGHLSPATRGWIHRSPIPGEGWVATDGEEVSTRPAGAARPWLGQEEPRTAVGGHPGLRRAQGPKPTTDLSSALPPASRSSGALDTEQPDPSDPPPALPAPATDAGGVVGPRRLSGTRSLSSRIDRPLRRRLSAPAGVERGLVRAESRCRQGGIRRSLRTRSGRASPAGWWAHLISTCSVLRGMEPQARRVRTP